MWPRSRPYLLVLPAVSVICILFLGGVGQGLLQSLGFFPVAGQNQFSIDAYKELFGNAEFLQSLGLTVRIALLSTVAASILGLSVAVGIFVLMKDEKRRSVAWLQKLVQVPMLLPHLAAAYLMALLFMQSGWFSRLLYALGWLQHISDFPIVVNEPFGWGIILTYTWKEAPFVALMLYPVLMRIQRSWSEVAQVFGADFWSFFREILLPLALPAWATASFIVFTFTFSAFEVPFLLGVTYPKMLPVLSYQLYTSGDLSDRPEALAINIILTVLTGAIGLIAAYLSKRCWNTERRGW